VYRLCVVREHVFYLLVLTAASAIAWTLDARPAYALCDEPANNDVTTTCSGVTVDQDNGAANNSGNDGYGSGAEDRVSVTVSTGASVTGTDHGINLNEDATINNAGAIVGQSMAGVFVDDTLVSLTNSGTITGDIDGVAADDITLLNNSNSITGNRDGILAFNTIQSLTNSGTISGNIDGVAANDITSLGNSGSITGNDDGIFIFNSAQSLSNSGTITGITGDGIDASNGSIGSLTNSGSITGDDDGVFADTTIGTIFNSGAITGTTDDGIDAGSITSLTNSGSIQAFDDAVFAAASIGTINNSGTITALNGNGVKAVLSIGNFINSGTIVAADDGVDVNDTLGSTIQNFVNTGTIISGEDAVDVDNLINLNNSGLIQGAEFGIFTENLFNLTNSGTIIGGTRPAIAELLAADTTLTLNAGSNIQGIIDLGGGLNTLNVGNGLSIANTFFSGPRGGPPIPIANVPIIGTTNGAPFAINGNKIAVVDPTGLAMEDEIVVDITNGIAHTVFGALNAARTGSSTATNGNAQTMYLSAAHEVPNASPSTRPRIWAKGFGSSRTQDGKSPTVDADHRIGGLVSGMDGVISAGTRAGGFLGGSTGTVDVAFDSQESDIDSIYGGVYLGTQMGSANVDVLITAGWTNHDWERQVANNLAPGGIQTGAADYDGYFVSPEASVTLAPAFGLVPSARVRYIGYFLDGFTETGALGDLSVGDRDLHIVQGRFQLAAPIITSGADSSYTRIEPYVGIEGRALLSGDNVGAVLLGQTLSFDPGGEDEVGGLFAGINASARIASNIDLYGNIEVAAETGSSERIGGNIGFRISF
jgi:uncharacterized protein with beta-barrel porin domain